MHYPTNLPLHHSLLYLSALYHFHCTELMKSLYNDCNWTRTQNHLVLKRTLNHGFESSCSHITFRFCACFEQGLPWHSGNYRVWIHSETRMWYDKNIQSLYNVQNQLNQISFKLKILRDSFNSVRVLNLEFSYPRKWVQL